ncbi:DUF7344 domain-containing protein [Halosimplex litoreum]|uniref:DUF7344 domain-containing protein n=1 Tax=Halosimplex litoreum TaxID=1198301 RepID=UPI001E5B8148|nr:hypothetical protein [Halosimplex litoreum]
MIDLCADERHDLLAVERRRVVLEALVDREEPVALADLAEWVAARETDAATPGEDATERVAVSLHHVHLPRMDDLGVLDYDVATNRVEAADDLAVSRSS